MKKPLTKAQETAITKEYIERSFEAKSASDAVELINEMRTKLGLRSV